MLGKVSYSRRELAIIAERLRRIFVNLQYDSAFLISTTGTLIYRSLGKGAFQKFRENFVNSISLGVLRPFQSLAALSGAPSKVTRLQRSPLRQLKPVNEEGESEYRPGQNPKGSQRKEKAKEERERF